VGQLELVARIESCGARIGQPGAQSRSSHLDQFAGHSVGRAAVSGMIPVHRGTEALGPGASIHAPGLPIDWNAILPVMVANY
jgi:hypothetical protein